eukprot:scaffold134547_cov109-Phaeocystis_antarctica.AAC.1
MAMGDYCSLLHSHVTARGVGVTAPHRSTPRSSVLPRLSRKTWRAGFMACVLLSGVPSNEHNVIVLGPPQTNVTTRPTTTTPGQNSACA